MSPYAVDVVGGEEGAEVHGVLEETLVANLAEFPLALDDLERMFGDGTNGGKLPVALLLH